MAEEDTEYLKLPVEDRCVHKLWKARVSGYEEATKLFNGYNPDESDWKKFAPIIKKFVVDSNAVAQEKGLVAAFAFVENSELAGRVGNEITEGLVLKCLGAPKTKTKELAKDILLMLCEIEVHEKVIEELIKGLGQKNPKIVVGCLTNMTECLKAFGAKVIKVSPLLKAAMPLLEHRDKAVREGGKVLIVESFRWVGAIMKQQLNGLKPVQITELEAEFEKVAEAGKARPERYLRSQMPTPGAGGGDDADGGGGGEAAGGGGDDGEEEDEAMDPYELMDPVDILSQLPKNFYDLVEEKKWQLRKEALDALLPLSQTPKISPGDFNELMRVIKKFIAKDTNVMLVALAAQCLAGLAKGLRASFKNHAISSLPICLEKFKEKKANVVNGLQEAVDAIYPVLNIEGIQEDTLAALKHKTPTVNAATAKYLARCFSKCPAQLVTNKKVLKGYVLALLDKLAHPDVTVRDSASEALGVLWKFMGEGIMTKLMPDLDNIKLTKIKEFAEKAELSGKPAAALAPKPPPAAKVVKPGGGAKVVKPKAKPAPPKSATPDSDDDYSAEFAAPPPKAAAPAKKPGSAPAGRGRAAADRKTSKPGAGRPGASASAGSSRKKGEDVDTSPLFVASNLKNVRFKDEAKFRVLKWNFTTPRTEFVDQLKDQMITANFNTTLIGQMFNKDFKQHLKAIESLNKFVAQDLDAVTGNLDLLLKWITLRFFETNPSVLLRGLEFLREVFTNLADREYNLHDIEAVSFIPYLLNKSGDPKDQVRNSVKTIVKLLCNVYPATKMSTYLMTGLQSKNAKQRTECLDELGHILQNHGSSVLQPSAGACLKEIAKQIADRDNSVRNAALNCITEIYFQDGDRLYKMIGNLPEKDMAMLEERIKRQSKTRAPPTTGVQDAPTAQQQQHQTVRSGGAGGPNPQVTARPGSNLASRLARPQMNSAGSSGGPRSGSATSNPDQAESQMRYGGGGGGPPPTQYTRGSPSRTRPVSGAFTLDLEKIESQVDRQLGEQGIRLVNHNLDEIFNDEPVMLPETVTGGSGNKGLPHHRQFSPSSALPHNQHHYNNHPQQQQMQLTDNVEAYEALDVVLAQILNQDAAVCISALKQIDDIIKDSEKVKLLGAGQRMDQLLQACYMQFRNVLYTKMRTDNRDMGEVMRLFQYLTMVLMSLYHHQDLTRFASSSALHDLVHVIICILLEPQVTEMPQGGQLTRALNVLTVKILDRSDHTNITFAFIKLLKEGIGNSSLQPKYMELVMKCLWKVIRAIPDWIQENMNLDLLLLELHEFLKAYPTSYWKKQDSDTPLRTIKTLLHSFVKCKGDEILDHLTRVDDPENSELVVYLRKLLSSGIGKENNANGSNNYSNNSSNIPQRSGSGSKIAAPSSGSSSGSRQIPRFSKSDHENLADIFKKIGHKDLTKQGLQELYNFKQQNPSADLEPFLAKSSHYFRDYIERGLKTIESEIGGSSVGGGHMDEPPAGDHAFRNGNRYGGGGSMGTGAQNVLSEASASDNNSTSRYLDRLRLLREKGGLPSSGGVPVSGSVKASASSQYRISATREHEQQQQQQQQQHHHRQEVEAGPRPTGIASSTAPPANVEDLRKRLEMIKQSSGVH